MSKIIQVKGYHRGLASYPQPITLNVSHIVLAYESEISVGPACIRKMCAHVDTMTIRGLVLDCTLSELLKEIEGCSN